MENKTENITVRSVPKSNKKILKRNKIYSRNAEIHDSSLWCLGTGTSIKVAG